MGALKRELDGCKSMLITLFFIVPAVIISLFLLGIHFGVWRK